VEAIDPVPCDKGAALANKRHGRLTLAFGGDGDFMFVPSTLWTAAHHRIPMLYIVHNNRAYHQEYMYLQAMAARHGRGISNTEIGTTIKDPNVDYATVARGFGVYGEGPIADPKDLGPALLFCCLTSIHSLDSVHETSGTQTFPPAGSCTRAATSRALSWIPVANRAPTSALPIPPLFPTSTDLLC
jgi:hypothetical protein